MALRRILASALVVAVASAAAVAQADGTVKTHQKLSGLEGGLQGFLAPTDSSFGHDVELLEDLDGDGIRELAVGGPGGDDGGGASGAIFILFLRPDGTVRDLQKISQTSGGFTGNIDGLLFGLTIASLGDVDGDGIGDLAAGTSLDEGSFGETSSGSVWILFLEADGTVKAHQKIAESLGGYVGDLPEFGHFGRAVEGIGDLDGDGTPELVVAAGSPNRAEILFLNPNGKVKSQLVIGAFGNGGLAWLGDLDGDGGGELAAGQPGGPFGTGGAVRIVSLHADGSFKSYLTISSGQNGFTGVLTANAGFGSSVAPAGDVNGDGVVDLLVGAPSDSKGGPHRGSAWILFLTPQGTVSGHVEISSTAGDFEGVLEDDDKFGEAVSNLGDLDGDGVVDVAVGSWGDLDGSVFGASWLLFLNGAVTSTWTNLGQGLPGSAGLPLLSGTGTLAPGSPVTLALTQARPFSPSFLVLSNAQLAAPFKGGTLVPAPSILFAITTDGVGEVSFSGTTQTWLPPGFTHFFQIWIQDPAGPAGLAASNGLAGTTPD